jgi:23S rRNA (guanosine2251-2'-O)-methyltransferase
MNDWKRSKSTQKQGRNQGRDNRPERKTKVSAEGGDYWLYGQHSVRAALDNPARQAHRLLATLNAAKNLGASPIEAEIVDRKAIDKLVTADAVHQGLALYVSPLPETHLADLLEDPAVTCLIILDQVTDPHNVGAIMRSAAAFGASAVVTTWRHSPPETAVLSRASSGTLELVPYIRGNNLADQLGKMQDAGFMLIGLDGEGDMTPEQLMQNEKARPDRFALVLGAEGKGMRHRTSVLCDILMRLPISDKVDSLNVSNAAAVALYALTQG